MRMKDIKHGRQSAPTNIAASSPSRRPSNETEADSTTDEEGLLLSDTEKESSTSSTAKAPPGPEKSDQAVINLISIDAARVADFCCRCYVLVGSISMLCVAIVALVRLLGWVSLGAGLMTVVLLFPANYVASKAYANAQVALMKYRDDRAAIATDALLGIRQIKFSATEPWWQQRIMATRVSELRQQRWVFVWIIALRLYWIISPILFSIASLTAYSWIHGSLSASVAFTAVGVFGSLEMALSSMPFAVSQLLETLVSCKRIEQHIWEFESPRYLKPGETINLENATVKWPTRESEYKDCADFMLRDVSVSFPRGRFCLIYGRSGCGKTLLLNSIIGEADLLSGNIYAPKPPCMWDSFSIRATASNWIVPSSFAYVAQVPWLENATIRDNITFGLPYDGERYEKVVTAAAMQDDLNALEQGDMTEIGSQGITLSGGQRCRIALAKALYSRAEILVMDDIFSAVDARVGRHILDEGLLGDLCKDRTIILATHHVSLCLPRAGHAIEICDNGQVRNIALDRSNKLKMTTIDRLKENVEFTIPRKESSAPRKPLVEGEFRESGIVKWPVYDRYIHSSGGWLVWILAFGVIVASQVAMLGRGWWMNLWTRWSNEQTSSSHGPTAHPFNEVQRQHDMKFYLVCYALISLSAALLEAVKCAVVYIAALQASKRLFETLISSVLRSRLRWLDVTPLGRILNRLTSDFVLIDSRIPGDTHTLCSALLALIATSVAGLSVTWYMIIPEVLLSALSLAYTAKYLRAARELQRLDSVLKSPILSLFSTSLVGRSTIRAYGKAEVYMHLMFDHLDNLSRAGWTFSVVSCWTSLRLGIIGALFAVAVAITIVIRDIDASLAGFALGFSLDLTKKMDNAIARYASLQLNMNSTERVVEFCDTETENFTGNNAPQTWPPEGRIFIDSLSVRYAPHLPDAIKRLSLKIAPRERIGVVGRTGAGKSSLSLAIFRILEARSGSITVDGIDISTIKLDQLRSRMAIIPQDPILFSGTVRSNLDPTNRYSESLLRDSLHRVHLLRVPAGAGSVDIEKRSVEESNVFGDLNMRISEGGSNLSQGQRQLLCLARAIINRCKIMVVDEATSAVDMHTDALIQNSIKEQFHQSTLIVIAHRLSTVADFDKVLVMAEGEVAEFDSPKNLLKRKGEFYKLVEASGEKEKVQAIISSQPTETSHSTAI
ncbi:MAG: hypothetical protein Q9167_004687 [Letrouitia subvulpina]